VAEAGTQKAPEDSRVEVATQTTPTVIATLVKNKKQWTRRAMVPYYLLVREEEEKESVDEAGPSRRELEREIGERKQEEDYLVPDLSRTWRHVNRLQLPAR